MDWHSELNAIEGRAIATSDSYFFHFSPMEMSILHLSHNCIFEAENVCI